MAANALLIFIKNPEKGKVKTRLAKTLGDDQALKIYLALLAHTRKTVEVIEADRYLYYSSFINKEDDWESRSFKKALQIEGDLGQKMGAAFKEVLAQHEKVLIIGSDCASLRPGIIEEAFAALDQRDFVIGPALDGGYYLLGMKTFQPQIFQDINWSTAEVLPQTLEVIKDLEKTVYQLESLSDIDFEEDWEKYGWPLD